MSTLSYLVIANIILMMLVLWTLFKVSDAAQCLEDLSEKNFARMAALIEECLDLKDKK